MPEPVVIYGWPAGRQVRSLVTHDPAEGPRPLLTRTRVERPSSRPRTDCGSCDPSLMFLGRASWAIARAILHVMRRYPRHSLAAAASMLILGGIYYTQTRSGTARRDVTTAIPRNQSPAEPDPKDGGARCSIRPVADAAKPDPVVAAAPKSGASDLQKKATADAATQPKPDEPSTATAQTDSPRSVETPGRRSLDCNSRPRSSAASALAKADTPEKSRRSSRGRSARPPPDGGSRSPGRTASATRRRSSEGHTGGRRLDQDSGRPTPGPDFVFAKRRKQRHRCDRPLLSQSGHIAQMLNGNPASALRPAP